MYKTAPSKRKATTEAHESEADSTSMQNFKKMKAAQCTTRGPNPSRNATISKRHYLSEDSEQDAYSDEDDDSGTDSDSDSEDDWGRRNNTGKKPLKRAVAERRALKQQLHDEELEFVIHTKDNNKPDPFGPRSVTAGKLMNQEVARRYNEKFSRSITGAAAEKRYRTGLARYLQAHPTYPRKIIYEGTEIPAPSFKHAQKHSLSGATLEGHAQRKKRRAHHAGYRPPKELVEATSLNRYIEDQWTVPDDEHPETVHVLVEDERGCVLGRVAIPEDDLSKSSRWYSEYRKHTCVRQFSISGLPKAAIERYAQCILPSAPWKLPEYEFMLVKRQVEVGTFEQRAVCVAIHWDFEALVDLYLVATELEDDRVRDLVLDRWRDEFKKGGNIEIEPSSLNLLFGKLDENDPAQRYWVSALHTHGLNEQICTESGWDSTLVESLEQTSDDDTIEHPWEWRNYDFRRSFHRTFAYGKSHSSKKSRGPAVFEYRTIARRLLLTPGWQSDDLLASETSIAQALKNQHMALREASSVQPIART